MAQTYTISPVSIPSIFEAIVSEVSTNLASATIPQVSFRHGTWVDILDELTIDSNSPDDDVKNNKYPLVCLIHQFDENPFDSQSEDAEFTLIIVTRSTATMRTDERYTANFIPILYPIYAELKQVIFDSMYFLGYNQAFSHTKRDLTHAGQESANGNTAYKLPDVLDGLLMSNIKLKVNLDPICAPATPNLCLLTPCQYGREIEYVNVIENVTITGLESSLLTAQVNEYIYIESGGGPLEPVIDWGTGGPPIAMTVPTPPALVPFVSTLDTSLLADGFYLGRISYDNSDVQFYYKIAGGVVTMVTSLVDISLAYDFTCADYPNNEISSNITYTISKIDGENNIISGYKYDLFGTQIVNETFNVVGTITKTNDDTNNFAGGTYMIIHKVERGGQTPLSCTLQIQTRCKAQF